ncbi:MAG: hypothetical protein U0802_20390 [Candidatus Binatia bacterium]
MPGTSDPVLLFTARLERAGLRYVVTGSVASIAYGEPRMTHDVDIVVELAAPQAAALAALFPLADFYFPPLEVVLAEAARAQRGHFSIIHRDSGFKADIYLVGRDPLHRWALEHARRLPIGDAEVTLAPPEYVVLRKLELDREGGSAKHVRDVRGVPALSPVPIDEAFVARWAARLGVTAEWDEVRRGAT